jgi:hypothetical protein
MTKASLSAVPSILNGTPAAQSRTDAAPSAFFRAEEQLLLACAQVDVSCNTADRIRALVRNNIDWEFVIRKADEHFITPLLYRGLSSIEFESMPGTARKLLQQRSYAHAKRSLFLTGELLRIVSLLDGEGIRAVPYKGPTLAATAYNNIGLRSFIDLDILVKKKDVLRAKRLLTSSGYGAHRRRTDAQEAVRVRSRAEKDIVLVREDGATSVELHWAVASSLLFPIGGEQLWERLQEVKLGQATVSCLCPEDMLLVLCVHGAKHFFKRLEWICDIAQTVNANPDISWSDVIERATKSGIRRMLFFGLIMASDLLDVDLDERVKSEMRQDAEARALALRAEALLFTEVNSTAKMFSRDSHRIGLRDSKTARMRLRLSYLADYARALMKPNEEDRKRMSLPRFLSFVYILLRPIRLMRTYGAGLSSGRRQAAARQAESSFPVRPGSLE